MVRVLAVLSAVALCVGCRTPESNPFAAFGSATIPPPTIEVPGSGTYYATPASPGANSTTAPPTNSLPSISVPSGTAPQPSVPRPYSFGSLSPSSTTPSFNAESSDREPIRVVEAAPNTTRIATAPPRAAATPSVVEAVPAAREPIRAFNNNASDIQPSGSGISPYVPTFGQPPASGGGFKSSGSFVTDSRVQPAAYQQAVPTFVEGPTTGNGQWKSR